MKCIFLLSITALSVSGLPQFYNPYYNPFRYNNYPPLPLLPYNFPNYANQIPHYSNFIPTFTNNLIEDRVTSAYISTPDLMPNLNVLAETPYHVSNRFTVVPMIVVAKENMNLLDNAHIMGVSTKKPIMMVKTEENVLPCTPAVKVVLDKPIIIYSLKTSILFPREIDVEHEGINIPIRVGAVIAPIQKDTFVSTETPVSINIVYAVPTKPIKFDYVNNNDVIISPDTQAVIIESEEFLPPKNVTVINFPDKEAEPSLQVDEEDEELVNRNPPIVLAPAGIVQSTQPQPNVEPFHNSKESPVLIALREEAKKKRA